MKKNLKLLVINEKEPSKVRLLESKMDRTRALNAAKTGRTKVVHDNGNRLMVIEASDSEIKTILKQLPDAKVVSLNSRFSQTISDLHLDENEMIFVDALKIRTSAKFIRAKKLRKYGDTPEEQKLTNGSCVQEIY